MTSVVPHLRPAADGGYAVTLTARPRPLTVVFIAIWLAAWLLLLAGAVLDYTRFGTASVLAIGLVVAGAPVALALLWLAGGKRETLVLSAAEARVGRWIGPFRTTISVPARSIRRIAVSTRFEDAWPLGDLDAVRTFYSGGNGVIAFESSAGPLSVGHGLSQHEAAELVDEMRRHLPWSVGLPVTASASRRASSLVGTMLVWVMLSVSVKLPTTAAGADRPTCFYDESVSPRLPIDMAGRRGAGSVLLVPLGDFPAERADVIAAHFRGRFNTPIETAPALPWPAGAFSDARRQVDSSVLLTALEQVYPGDEPHVVAIGLTTEDMFNPEFNASYAFSYRRGNRLAVVSSARMAYGCLGLVRADESRIMARLRKMVGKNVGLLHYGLPISDDPASVLYGLIGGPQELDAMSEQF